VDDPSALLQAAGEHSVNKQRLVRLTQLEAVWHANVLPQIDAASTLSQVEQLTASKERMKRIRQLFENYNETTAQREAAYKEYKHTEEQLTSLTGLPCPTCGKPL
jgi:archaellum biogenesis protein FlaJ (TadC family)